VTRLNTRPMADANAATLSVVLFLIKLYLLNRAILSSESTLVGLFL